MPDHPQPKKQVSRAAPWAECLTAIFLLLLCLTACGKKPNQVDPPPGVEENAFPKTYPDPTTDPKP